MQRIADALEKNGYGEYKYRLHKASLEEPTVDEQKSYLTELLETLDYEVRRKRIHKVAMKV